MLRMEYDWSEGRMWEVDVKYFQIICLQWDFIDEFASDIEADVLDSMRVTVRVAYLMDWKLKEYISQYWCDSYYDERYLKHPYAQSKN